jgi:hypothetical protein
MFPTQGAFGNIMGMGMGMGNPMQSESSTTGISLAALAEEQRKKRLLGLGLEAQVPPAMPTTAPIALIGSGPTIPDKQTKIRMKQYTAAITDPKLRKQEKERQKKAK